MSADTPRATAEDGFTPGDDPGEGSGEGTTDHLSEGPASPTPGTRSGTDAGGDTATWPDPVGGRPGAPPSGPPLSGPPPAGPPPGRVHVPDAAAEDAGDPAEFAEAGARARARGDGPRVHGPEADLPNFVSRSSAGREAERDPNGHTPGAPLAGPGAPGPDGIPPPPTLEPGSSPGPGGPQPAHLRSAPGEGPRSSPLSSIPLRVPKLPNLRGLPGLRRRERERGPRRVRGLRVNQRLWRVDPWSVFKVSALFYLCLFFILMVAGTLLWNVGRSSGTIDQFESFVTRLGAYGSCVAREEVPEGTEFETDDDCPEGRVLVDGFELDDGTIFRAAVVGGAVLVVTGALGNVLMTVLLNLINEVSGGTRYTIIKEPTPRPPGAPRPGGPANPGGPAPPVPTGPPEPPDGSTTAVMRR